MSNQLLACAILASAIASPAMADPFVREAGEGRLILNFIPSDSPRGFDARGNVIDIDDYDQDQLYATFEYGVTEDLTAIVAPSLRHVAVQGAPSTTGLGYTEVGARYRLYHGAGWTVSTQALLRIPGQGRSDAIAQVGNTSTDIDLRMGAAYAGPAAFASAESGYRLRSGDLPNEFHGVFNIGANVTERLMLLGTSANTFSDGAGQGIFNEKYRYGDVYASAVYKLNNNIRLQIGYTTTIYGRNALKQSGPLLGVWFEF